MKPVTATSDSVRAPELRGFLWPEVARFQADHDVEQRDVGFELVSNAQAFIDVVGNANLMPSALDQQREQLRGCRIVVHDQYARGLEGHLQSQLQHSGRE
ncbi:MAG: hypothetical protein WDO74_08735 [Pseudomonadota bacterium]